MFESRRNAGRWATSAALAASLLISNLPLALAAPGDVNSTNDGQVVQGGMYYNTQNNWTTFQNSAGTGLHVQTGSTVYGREVSDAANPAASMTGNGGNILFNAPGQVVRIDGNIDANGIMGQSGALVGNGGHVRIESAFLYQNGQIYANGVNGGQVQFNVGGMTMGPNAAISAQGVGGAGGVVGINASGAVDIAKGAIIDTSGAVIGNYNTNVIAIQGGLVNLDGILMANGLNPGQQGGKVDVRTTGGATPISEVAMLNAPQLISAAERQALINRDAQLRATKNGSIQVGADGQMTANGSDGVVGNNPTDGGNGGLVNLVASAELNNDGLITANGGNGGTNPDVARGTVSRFYKGQELFTDQNGTYVLKGQDGQGNPVYTDEWGSPISVNPADLNAAYVQHSIGQNGGNGGDGGTVLVRYGTTATSNGAIEVVGGNGGDGQMAVADAQGPEFPAQIAQGGNGGNGGTGGYVELIGGVGAKLPSASTLANINVNGGSGGYGGSADTKNDCGCEIPGSNGACGAPGKITYRVDEKPSEKPPTPLFPPYPKEYPRLGDALPGRQSPVLSYTKSIFLARAPLPVIQKRQPPPKKVMFTQIVPAPATPAPKPQPPQKKKVVRGFW
ncbi:MAG TPA: hypothetical protein V6C52_10355 [Coleofasciculaceae cyanobacterium]|jgi:hypothetical protein